MYLPTFIKSVKWEKRKPSTIFCYSHIKLMGLINLALTTHKSFEMHNYF